MNDKNSQQRWHRLHIACIEAGLCDPDRRKTLKALRKFADSIPGKDFDRIPSFTTIFAPSADTLGLVDDWFHPRGPESSGVRIYLSPRLESLSQSKVDSVVAHEFAHAILRHEGESFPMGKAPKQYQDLPQEIAADKLIEKWGYAPATRKGGSK